MLQHHRRHLNDLCITFGRDHETALATASRVKPLLAEYHALYCNLPIGSIGLEAEFISLGRYLARSDQQIATGDWDELRRGHENVIEILSFNRAQLYRSASFFRFKTYPLVTLMTKDNQELYTRETEAQILMNKQIEILRGTGRSFRFEVPTHMFWERLGTRDLGHHWQVKLGFCAPVCDRLTGEARGFVFSHRTRQVFSSPFFGSTLRLVQGG